MTVQTQIFPRIGPALTPGEPAPMFSWPVGSGRPFSIGAMAGRYLVLGFLGRSDAAAAQGALRAVLARRDLFDDRRASFFGITTDAVPPEGEPGYRFFHDPDLRLAQLYRLADGTGFRPGWIVADPGMRVIASIPFAEDGADVGRLLALLDGLPPPEAHIGEVIQAPVLILPRVFEPELCAHLIALYESRGGIDSGFMREEGGRTLAVSDPRFKRRQDHVVADEDLIDELRARFRRRVLPEIARAFHFHATRMERYIVARYAAEDGGHFAAHRDNTTAATAHRRFAVSINLNADFEGGEVSFPEYGPRGFKAPVGGAVVFSCALLHQVSRVTRGQRFAFLPFLYDEAAARIRARNAQYLGPG